MRVLLLGCCALLATSCLLHEVRPPPTRRVVQLLEAVAEQETATFTAQRTDLEVDTREHDRTPRVVASNETALLRLEGTVARLYGDAEGTQGWAVDNALLLEVLDRQGKVLARMVAGFSDPVLLGKEHVDNLGRQGFTFEPGEIDLTARLPESEPFRLRATVLDYALVGRVTDVFLVLAPPAMTPR